MADDPELKAMAAIKAALEPLDPEIRGHVLGWAVERFEIPITSEGSTTGESSQKDLIGGKNGGGEMQ